MLIVYEQGSLLFYYHLIVYIAFAKSAELSAVLLLNIRL